MPTRVGVLAFARAHARGVTVREVLKTGRTPPRSAVRSWLRAGEKGGSGGTGPFPWGGEDKAPVAAEGMVVAVVVCVCVWEGGSRFR